MTTETRVLTLLSLGCVLSAAWPIGKFRRSFRQTAMRSATVWVVLTSAAWVLLSALAVLEREPASWSCVGPARLFAIAMLLTPIVCVLGARRPGELAWNFIVITLLLIYSQPILEQLLLGKRLESDRFGLDGPRMTFYIVIAAVGVLNYLPTRFGISAIFFAVGTGLGLAAVGPWSASAPTDVSQRTAMAGITLSAAVWSASLRRSAKPHRIDAAWLRLRDGWGLVWSARVRERWNATARYYGWNMRLAWSGLGPARADQDVTPSVRAAGEEELRHLLRRFFEPDDEKSPRR